MTAPLDQVVGHRNDVINIVSVDAGEFASYRDGLVELLLDAVRQGASVGFLDDLEAGQARVYFDGVEQALRTRQSVLWVATEGQSVIGSVQLALCLKPNGLNRAEVNKLLVLQAARRRGIGARLMQALEHQAVRTRRGLLYLDTEAGSPAEAFYQRLGYLRAGEIPDYAARPDGTYHPTVFYYKRLSMRSS